MPVQVGTEQHVNTFASNTQIAPSVAVLADGGWVVTWASSEQDGDGFGIYQQRYDATGATLGQEDQVNIATADTRPNPASQPSRMAAGL